MRALLGIAVVMRAKSERLLLTRVPDLVDLGLLCSLCVCVFVMGDGEDGRGESGVER